MASSPLWSLTTPYGLQSRYRIVWFQFQHLVSNTFSSRAFLCPLVYGLDCEIFVLGGQLRQVYCLGWGIDLHDIQIGGIYNLQATVKTVRSQYKQVAAGGSLKLQRRHRFSPGLHLAWCFRQLKFRGKWFLWEKTIRLVLCGAVTS